MPNTSFRTYKKIDKPKISLGVILIISFLSSILILLINQKYKSPYSEQIENIILIIVYGSIGLFIFKLFKSQFEKQKLYGKIAGNLELFSDRIEIGDRTIMISEIKTVRIKLEDYEGRREILLSNTTVPKISHGFNNLLTIELITSDKIKINFEQKFENQFSRRNKDVLIEYYKEEKLPFNNLLDILQISEYEQIQNLKKTIANNE
ncbi:hypothetical protein [Salinimicrobium sp. HB62]|uniref:hypothetical protein n=1 Tax=Salinimicrobium sp. HB62 TaxID=3077781 RepID=UPI002D796214|nr:hypothetical protein [Salinimicrobium sp. HB62]